MWGDVGAYDHFMGRYSNRLAHEFAAAGGVRPGDRVLDVGCGPGALTSVLAGIVGPEQVSGVDPTEAFVEHTRRRVAGADLRVGPAEALPFEDGTFDRALSQLVFHFVDDPAASVAEMVRVTRPGGLVGACVWDATGGMTMIRAYWDAAREVDPKAPDEAERFGSNPGQLAGLWRDAGLGDVSEGLLTVSSSYDDFDELWDSFLVAPGPIGAHRAGLDGSLQEAVHAALYGRVGSPAGPFELAASAWYTIGVV